MVKKYIKKPVEIEAVQWTGDNLEEIYTFVGKNNVNDLLLKEDNELYIKTIEGNMHASINDFIIKGIKGEFYPCKPDIFYNTYGESSESIASQFKACPNKEIAIYILDFIKRQYEKRLPEDGGCRKYVEALKISIDALNEHSSWINIIDRFPEEKEYLTVRDDNTSYYTRILIAYQTDTVMYDICYYDGYKWFNERGYKIENVIAWKPFISYEKDGN